MPIDEEQSPGVLLKELAILMPALLQRKAIKTRFFGNARPALNIARSQFGACWIICAWRFRFNETIPRFKKRVDTVLAAAKIPYPGGVFLAEPEKAINSGYHSRDPITRILETELLKLVKHRAE